MRASVYLFSALLVLGAAGCAKKDHTTDTPASEPPPASTPATPPDSAPTDQAPTTPPDTSATPPSDTATQPDTTPKP